MAGKLSYRKTGAKAFSHSRLEALDSCARKFEIEGKLGIKKYAPNVTFAFGHGFGEGVQAAVAGKSYEEAVWEVFSKWEVPLDMEGTKSDVANKKNFWECIEFIRIFYEHMNIDNEGHLNTSRKINWSEWEIAKFRDMDGNIKDAVELELLIDLGDGFYYEGHIDLVLKHKHKEHFAILELKTSSLSVMDAALYGYSPQPTGYMMVLDTFLVKDNPYATTSFDVFYLVGSPKDKTFYEYQFTKTPLHRTQWLSYIMGKMAMVETYEGIGLPYPINFKSCFGYRRRCPHYGTCHLPNSTLVTSTEHTSAYAEEASPPDIFVTLAEIIERQSDLLEEFEVINFMDESEISLSFSDKPTSNDYLLDVIRVE